MTFPCAAYWVRDVADWRLMMKRIIAFVRGSWSIKSVGLLRVIAFWGLVRCEAVRFIALGWKWSVSMNGFGIIFENSPTIIAFVLLMTFHYSPHSISLSPITPLITSPITSGPFHSHDSTHPLPSPFLLIWVSVSLLAHPSLFITNCTSPGGRKASLRLLITACLEILCSSMRLSIFAIASRISCRRWSAFIRFSQVSGESGGIWSCQRIGKRIVTWRWTSGLPWSHTL